MHDDVLYALPDIAFDRAHKLHSIPAALGERRAIDVARAMHGATVLCLLFVGIGVFPDLSLAAALYGVGVLIAASLLVYEHSLVRVGDLSKLDAAFFTMNGVISLTLFAFVLAGRLLVAWSVRIPWWPQWP